MLLAIDAGNTNITMGLFDGSRLAATWRLRTIHEQTADEWGILMRSLFQLSDQDPSRVDGMIVASVVPPVDATLALMAQRYFHTEPLFVTHDLDTGLINRYDNPREVGADRIVNGVAAFHQHGGPCIVVDLGTAITFDAISAKGEYLGGVIAAGIGISIGALVAKTARLPLVEFRQPATLIGSNTMTSIQSGLFYGALGTIDGIVDRLVAELGPKTKVIGTGGQARLIAPFSRYLGMINENLTLEGLELIWKRHQRT